MFSQVFQFIDNHSSRNGRPALCISSFRTLLYLVQKECSHNSGCNYFSFFIQSVVTLVDIYVRTLRAEMMGKANKKPEMSIIGGCLRGLCSYLVNFSQSVAEGG